MPNTPTHQNSEFNFSPGQHAEKLRLLKKSPGFVGYAQKTRPMFNKNSDPETPSVSKGFVKVRS